jgi:hypothetical protein
MIEKTKIIRDLDLLFNEIEIKKKSILNSYEQLQNSLNSFHVIAENMRV